MKSFLFAIGIVTSLLLFGQVSEEQLNKDISAATSWSQKVILYDSLLDRFAVEDPEKYKNYLKEIISTSRSERQFEYTLKYTIELINSYESSAEFGQVSQVYTDSLLRDSTSMDLWIIADLFMNQGLVYDKLEKRDSALFFYLKAGAIFEELADSSQTNYGKSFHYAAEIAMDMANFLHASELLQKGMRIYEYQKDTLFLLYTYNEIATLYSINGFFDLASSYRQMLLEQADSEKHLDLLVITYLNYSNTARKTGQDSLELALLKNAVILGDTSANANKSYQYIALCKLINAFSRRDRNQEVISTFQKMKLLEPEMRETQWLTQFYQRARADAWLSQRKYNQAIVQALEIQKTAVEKKDVETIKDMDRLLNRIYLKKGDYRNAYQHFEAYHQLNDSLTNLQKANALAFIQEQYDSEKKERKINSQESEIKLLAATNAFQMKLIWLSIIVSIVLIFAVYLFISRRNAKISQLAQVRFSRQLLAAQEEERKRISMDLHDSVGQSLMLIKNKVVLNQDEETIDMVSKALDEVRTISKALHPVLLDKFGLTASIQKLVRDIDQNTEILFEDEIDNIDNIFPRENEVQIFRIIQETLNNLVKHSQSPSALVKITRSETSIELLVADKGVGFDMTSKVKSTESLGMKTLIERTQILGGKIFITSLKNEGTNVLFKLNKPAHV